MQRKITRVKQALTAKPRTIRVAAYARVSSGKDAMLHSLSAQVSYYSSYIQKNAQWEYVGVYADEAMTGTKDGRVEFQRLLSDCRAGLVQMVITKSISRFARNTVTMLETVRELKAINVDVFFEKENIHSMSGDGELMLTILASFAQEESRSVSENCKWRIRKQFKDGLPSCATMLGYRMINGNLQIVPEEAELIKRIFSDFLGGLGRIAIAKKLREEGSKTRNGGDWRESTIEKILKNEKYTGDLLLQKTYVSDHIEKKKRMNNGRFPMYHVKNNHVPIIDKETFLMAQEECKKRAQKFHACSDRPAQYPFSGKIVCQRCGMKYRRKISNAGSKYEKPVWICPTFNFSGKAACSSQQIPEDILYSMTTEILGLDTFDDSTFQKKIKKMVIPEHHHVVFVFQDGAQVERQWKNKLRNQKRDKEAFV